ncbi:MAG: cyclase family protein [Ktedonobacteraceae bacterium]
MASNVLAQLLEELATGQLKIIDLSSPLGPETPVIDLPPMFAPSPGATLTEISHYDERGPGWYWNVISMGEHTGTHFDAPIHWVTGKDLPNNATDTILPGKFIGPAYVIDITREVEQSPDFLLMPEHIEQWEAKYGRIPSGAWVLLRTGWGKRTSREEFLNIQADGPHTPGFHQTSSQFLANERDILGVGVETVGTDAGAAGGFNPPFPNHTFMHGAGKFGITSLINLELLPLTGAIVIAAPLKIVNGSGSPLRVIAITQ